MLDDTEARAPEPGLGGPAPEAGPMGRAIDRLGVIFAVAILCSAAILGLEVVLRYVFHAPTVWAHESVIFLTAISFVFGGLYVAARNGHIRVVLIYDALPPKMRRRFDVVISLACLISTAVFAWAAWQSVKRSVWTPAGDFRLETTGSAWDPPTPGLLKVFLFVILIAMAVQFAILAWNYARRKVD